MASLAAAGKQRAFWPAPTTMAVLGDTTPQGTGATKAPQTRPILPEPLGQDPACGTTLRPDLGADARPRQPHQGSAGQWRFDWTNEEAQTRMLVKAKPLSAVIRRLRLIPGRATVGYGLGRASLRRSEHLAFAQTIRSESTLTMGLRGLLFYPQHQRHSKGAVSGGLFNALVC